MLIVRTMRTDATARRRSQGGSISTEQLRTGDIHLSSMLELVFAGQIAEVTEGHVLLTRSDGAATMIPRWMADAVQRDRVGDLLALVADRLDGTSEVIEVIPAIYIDYEPVFRPYGRRDSRNRTITAKDARQITGEPRPLRILVPVLIDVLLRKNVHEKHNPFVHFLTQFPLTPLPRLYA